MFRTFLFPMLCVLFLAFPISAQIIMKLDNVNLDKTVTNKIYTSLDALFIQIDKDQIDDKYVAIEHPQLTILMLKQLKDIEENKKDKTPDFLKKQIINFYRIDSNKYLISIAYIGQKENDVPKIRMIFNIVAEELDGKIKFNLPLIHQTKTWRSKKVGRINYIFRDSINLKRAKKFNQKNTKIAKKLRIQAEEFTFYMCDNYQEIMKLLGVEYDSETIGQTRDGYGVIGGHIFSIMNNEDFSHDVFHYYSGKIHRRVDRNWITEEGIAYSWGNAYYTNKYGEMIEQNLLVGELRRYLKKNPDTNLLELFEKNTKIFNHIAPDVSVRSTISSLICDEVEKQKGLDGIIKLINAGRSPNQFDNFFRVTKDLISLDRNNFNERVQRLIEDYK